MFHASRVVVVATSLRAEIVTTYWPTVFGVPLIAPVPVFRLSPGGSRWRRR